MISSWITTVQQLVLQAYFSLNSKGKNAAFPQVMALLGRMSLPSSLKALVNSTNLSVVFSLFQALFPDVLQKQRLEYAPIRSCPVGAMHYVMKTLWTLGVGRKEHVNREECRAYSHIYRYEILSSIVQVWNYREQPGPQSKQGFPSAHSRRSDSLAVVSLGFQSKGYAFSLTIIDGDSSTEQLRRKVVCHEVHWAVCQHQVCDMYLVDWHGVIT